MPDFDTESAYLEYLNGGAVTEWQERQEWARELFHVSTEPPEPDGAGIE